MKNIVELLHEFCVKQKFTHVTWLNDEGLEFSLNGGEVLTRTEFIPNTNTYDTITQLEELLSSTVDFTLVFHTSNE